MELDKILCVFAFFRCTVTLPRFEGRSRSLQNGGSESDEIAKISFRDPAQLTCVHLKRDRDCLERKLIPRPNLHRQKCDGSEVITGRGIAGRVSGIWNSMVERTEYRGVPGRARVGFLSKSFRPIPKLFDPVISSVLPPTLAQVNLHVLNLVPYDSKVTRRLQ